ncbi:hypothetical protein E2C01_048868 [Portunus trituberculatus]|uniref:Uncharacterized protein n=1 Tax=Portunus trituberculatus TaxID=210409 RepID=A0A5B7GBB1_PORTR|nr:hypothetical protein [Portunus trituberculatus]
MPRVVPEGGGYVWVSEGEARRQGGGVQV